MNWAELWCRYVHSHFHWHRIGSAGAQECSVCGRRYSYE